MSRTSAKDIQQTVEARVGRKMQPNLSQFQSVLQDCGIARESDVSDDFISALVSSGWWDGNAAFSAVSTAMGRRPADSREGLVLSSQPLDTVTTLTLPDLHVLGGAGFPLRIGDVIDAEFALDGMTIVPRNGQPFHTSYSQLVDIELTGGTEVSGGGFIGGGFGLTGAAIGMATAAVLNAATTQAHTYTLLRLEATQRELFLLLLGEEPITVRMALSYAFTCIRMNRPDTAAGP